MPAASPSEQGTPCCHPGSTTDAPRDRRIPPVLRRRGCCGAVRGQRGGCAAPGLRWLSCSHVSLSKQHLLLQRPRAGGRQLSVSGICHGIAGVIKKAGWSRHPKGLGQPDPTSSNRQDAGDTDGTQVSRAGPPWPPAPCRTPGTWLPLWARLEPPRLTPAREAALVSAGARP